MKINKAYKFRIYPTLEQQNQINKTLGCTRLIYNYYLNKKQTLYNTNKKIQNIRLFQNFECLCYNLISNKMYFLGCKMENNDDLKISMVE